MSEYFIGQIMLTGFNFPQRGFAFCNGQLLPISQNQALFSLLGVQYGGNGQTNFALPDLRGRTPVGAGGPSNYVQGTVFGVENVSLLQNQIPPHSHTLNATNQTGTVRNPSNSIYGTSSGESLYGTADNAPIPLAANQVQSTGSGAPHSNMQPSLTINFNIALTGIFPSRS
jgi:microcystin-dependent protein